MYQSLLDNIKEFPTKAMEKWTTSLSLPDDIQWKNLFKIAFQCTIENKLRNFQYKFIHRITYTNDRLCQWGLVESTLCDFCNSNIDTIIHRFWMCEHSQIIWNKMWNWAKTLTDLPSITLSLAILNVDIDNNIPLVIHHIIILTKFYIYRCFISKIKPFWASLKHYIYMMI